MLACKDCIIEPLAFNNLRCHICLCYYASCGLSSALKLSLINISLDLLHICFLSVGSYSEVPDGD